MKVHAEGKQYLVEHFKESDSPVTFTTYMWTSCQTQGYITVTAHFLDKAWKLESCILAIRRVDQRHTGENIAKLLNDIQKEFCIKEVAAMTTDNASNNVVDARETGFDHVGCYAHTLQLPVNGELSIQGVNKITVRGRKLVSFFNKSVVGMQALEDYQKREKPEDKPLHLLNDVETR